MINKDCKLGEYWIDRVAHTERVELWSQLQIQDSTGCMQLEETLYSLQPSPSSSNMKLIQNAKLPKDVYLQTILQVS